METLVVRLLITLALAALASASAASGHHDEEDGANSDIAKTYNECVSKVGDTRARPPRCKCLRWEKGQPVPDGCNIERTKALSEVERQGVALARGILWVLGYAQTLLVLLAAGSVLALGASAYAGSMNVQWLSVVVLLTVVGAGATSIVSFIGSGYEGEVETDLWENPGQDLVIGVDGARESIEPVWNVKIRGDARERDGQ